MNYSMKIIFRKTNNNDLNQIFDLFKLIFKKKISKKYYLLRYQKKNYFNSFVAINNDKIIGHVGFVKHFINKKNYFIYSRHTSMVVKNMRRHNIYTQLCDYAYKSFKKRDNFFGILVFPNKKNYTATNKKFNVNYFKHKEIYSLLNNKKFLKIKHLKLNLKIVNEFIKINKKSDFYKKKLFFFKNIYLTQNKNFFYFKNSQDIIIYNINYINKKRIINILDSTCNGTKYFNIINQFVNSNVEKYTQIKLWFNKDDENSIKLFKSIGFKNTRIKMMIGLITFSKKNKSEFNNLRYNNLLMGDTDVFHDIN